MYFPLIFEGVCIVGLVVRMNCTSYGLGIYFLVAAYPWAQDLHLTSKLTPFYLNPSNVKPEPRLCRWKCMHVWD